MSLIRIKEHFCTNLNFGAQNVHRFSNIEEVRQQKKGFRSLLALFPSVHRKSYWEKQART
jgi:hypothetical protein